jgi:hypothetical protein
MAFAVVHALMPGHGKSVLVSSSDTGLIAVISDADSQKCHTARINPLNEIDFCE